MARGSARCVQYTYVLPSDLSDRCMPVSEVDSITSAYNTTTKYGLSTSRYLVDKSAKEAFI